MGLLFKCKWKMKSTALNSSLKKATRPPEHHWCTQQQTAAAKLKPYHGFNILQQRKLPRKAVTVTPQNPPTMKQVSLVQFRGIEEYAYDHFSVFNTLQVFKLQNREQCSVKSPSMGPGRQTQLPVVPLKNWPFGPSMTLPPGLIQSHNIPKHLEEVQDAQV